MQSLAENLSGKLNSIEEQYKRLAKQRMKTQQVSTKDEEQKSEKELGWKKKQNCVTQFRKIDLYYRERITEKTLSIGKTNQVFSRYS